jgi:hypothetical protein
MDDKLRKRINFALNFSDIDEYLGAPCFGVFHVDSDMLHVDSRELPCVHKATAMYPISVAFARELAPELHKIHQENMAASEQERTPEEYVVRMVVLLRIGGSFGVNIVRTGVFQRKKAITLIALFELLSLTSTTIAAVCSGNQRVCWLRNMRIEVRGLLAALSKAGCSLVDKALLLAQLVHILEVEDAVAPSVLHITVY